MSPFAFIADDERNLHMAESDQSAKSDKEPAAGIQIPEERSWFAKRVETGQNPASTCTRFRCDCALVVMFALILHAFCEIITNQLPHWATKRTCACILAHAVLICSHRLFRTSSTFPPPPHRHENVFITITKCRKWIWPVGKSVNNHKY
jgi:hypothetical protein